MNGEIAEALRSNRAVTVSIVVAAAAVTACALVAIALMLGWTPSRSDSRSAATNGSVALVPGETLVAPAEAPKRPEPLMPTYSQPTPPPPAPAETPGSKIPGSGSNSQSRDSDRSANSNLTPPHPTDTFPVPTVPVPRTPSYARPAPQRAPAPSTSPSRARAAYCENCGRVSTITTYPGLWEVRVRFEDGASSTFRFRSPPPFRPGDRVRYEDDRLVPD